MASANSGFDNSAKSSRSRREINNVGLPYRVAQGDDLAQDTVLTPATVRMCMDGLAKFAPKLAYTPEIQQRCEEALERKFDEDMGGDAFVPPNYAVYDDPNLAAFYGVQVGLTSNLQTRKETFEEQRARLVQEVVREVEPELRGLWMNMEQFRREDWARHGVADEKIYTHVDPNQTLFRNYDNEWGPIDRPIATGDKFNIIDLFEAEPEFTFPQPHPGWEVDRPKGLWSSFPEDH